MTRTMKISDEKRKEIWDKYEEVQEEIRKSLKGIVQNEYDITNDMLIHHTKCTEDICNMLEDLNDMVTDLAMGL